ncbi:MAG: hypothetical protein EB140_16385, partial [Proteobacteria bacterium]|nr:hypothetical protein [Pseudomonadota bacterium]
MAEDGGDMQIVALTRSYRTAALVTLHGHDKSEITGPAFSPDGRRLYFSSQRGTLGAAEHGLTYELDLGATGLFILGGCGEGAWLTSGQRLDVVKHSVKVSAGRAPVLAGVMLPATGPTLDEVRRATDAGADALVAGSPYYNDVDGDAHVRHIEAILDASPLPILLYNIPQSTHHNIAPSSVAKLAHEPRILGIKDSSGNLAHFQALLRIKERRPDFRVLQGAEFAMAASALLGGDGAVPGMGNLTAGTFKDLFEAARRSDLASVRTLQIQINDLAGLHSLAGHWLASLKGAISLLGYGAGIPAQPLVPASPAQLEAIRKCLESHLP